MAINLSLYSALKDSARKVPNNVAIAYQGKKYSFKKFVSLIDRMADILSNKLHIQQDDVVLIAQPNIPDTLILFYALNKIGAICNMVHPFTPYNQIRNIIAKTNTKVAFLFEQRIAKEVDRYRDLSDLIYVTRIEDHLPIFKKLFYHVFMNRAIRKKLGKYRGSFKGFRYLHSLKPTGEGANEVYNKSKKVSVYLHSGSTTGDPKTICLCDENFNYICFHADTMLSIPPDNLVGKVFLGVLPSFHGFGLCICMLLPLVNRCGVALVPKFSSKAVVQILDKFKISVINGVPTMFESLLKDEKFRTHKNLKYIDVCYCGGDSLTPETTKDFNQVIKNMGGTARVFEGYGLTEAVAVNCMTNFNNDRAGSIGRAIPEAQIEIRDEEGNIVPRGTIGEITIKSDAIMVGYLNDPENTKKAIRDGWLYTGDLGHMDEDGFVYFDSRKKRVTKVSGVAVFPTEVEKLIDTIPGVEKCCVIEIPDARMQHALKAFVVAKYFDEYGMKEKILDTCRKYLIRWSVPKEIEFVKDLPTTLLGKIDFKELQRLENEKRGIK